jgi:hypothetical protein
VLDDKGEDIKSKSSTKSHGMKKGRSKKKVSTSLEEEMEMGGKKEESSKTVVEAGLMDWPYLSSLPPASALPLFLSKQKLRKKYVCHSSDSAHGTSTHMRTYAMGMRVHTETEGQSSSLLPFHSV